MTILPGGQKWFNDIFGLIKVTRLVVDISSKVIFYPDKLVI